MDERVERAATIIVDAAFEVHRALGPGHLESVYEKALAVEVRLRGVPFERQVCFNLSYKGEPVGEGRIDLLVDHRLVVELKAVEALNDLHLAQALSYLRATGHRLALLVNFNVAKISGGIRRVAL